VPTLLNRMYDTFYILMKHMLYILYNAFRS
jgi:hypothetical protein